MKRDIRRVLFVNDFERQGGAERIMSTQREALEATGITTEIFLGNRVSPGRNALTYIRNTEVANRLTHTIRRFEPDVVHVHNYYHHVSPFAIRYAATQTRVPFVFTAHDYASVAPSPSGQYFRFGRAFDTSFPVVASELCLRRWDRRSRSRSVARVAQHVAMRWIYKIPRLFVSTMAPSAMLVSALKASGYVNVRLVRNPLESLPAPRAQDAPAHLPVRVAIAGRLIDDKGVAGFLGTVPSQVRMQFIVIGDGPARVACEGIASRRGLDAHFVGRIRDRQQYVDQLASCHLLVVPSTWRENEPTVVAEALQLGLAIAVGYGSAASEVVDTCGGGYTYDVGSPVDVKRMLEDVLDDFPKLSRGNPGAYLCMKRRDAHIEALLETYESGSDQYAER